MDSDYISPSADGETLRGLRGFIWKTSRFVEIAACEEAFVYDKIVGQRSVSMMKNLNCLLYTSDAADE